MRAFYQGIHCWCRNFWTNVLLTRFAMSTKLCCSSVDCFSTAAPFDNLPEPDCFTPTFTLYRQDIKGTRAISRGSTPYVFLLCDVTRTASTWWSIEIQPKVCHCWLLSGRNSSPLNQLFTWCMATQRSERVPGTTSPLPSFSKITWGILA